MAAANDEAWWARALEELDCANRLKPSNPLQAYHHAGQAVEFALKAIYMRRNGHATLPATCKGANWHDLSLIADQARIKPELDSLERMDKARFANWLTARDWDSNARFPGNKPPGREVNDLFLAVCNERTGILRWLEKIFQKG